MHIKHSIYTLVHVSIQKNKAQVSGFIMEKMTKSVVSMTVLNDGEQSGVAAWDIRNI